MRITKQYIKDLEEYEYQQIKTLERIKKKYEEEGNEDKVCQLAESIMHQMGRWSMMSDLIEEMEK